ncbi:MAG: AAA family ATPase, partial [Burkholderiales bacterium]|nr:AAA family ATPase [Burkholderiales bacterium]
MRNSIAMMNTKGGVGKSTLVMAVAETLSAHHRKNVLVVDSDAQSSVSSMLMTVSS